MKKKLLIYIVSLLPLALFAEDLEFNILGLDFDLGGDLRSRSAYWINPDLDKESSDSEFSSDIRGRLELKVTRDSPFYGKALLEWGNIEWTDSPGSEEWLDLEFREFYVGFKNDKLKVKAGAIDLNTPGGYVYDSDEWGFQVKYDFSLLEAKLFYTPADLTEGSNDSMEPGEYMDHLIFLGVTQDKYLDLDIWGMFYHGATEEFTFNSFWFGTEGEKEIEDFTLSGGYTYNVGNVVTYDIPLSSYYTHFSLEYEGDKRKTLFSRFNLTGGSEGSLDSTGQFQNPDGEGNLDTDLALLFGGGPYSSQSYFDKESLSIVSDNLCEGDISFYDPGLFTYETGFEWDLKKILPLDMETTFVLGGANTGDLLRDGYFDSLIGWEGDIHNKIEITDDLEFNLSFAYLLPGNAFNAVYELNYDDTLELDTAFMASWEVKYSF
ncbi:MAG: hypothetical protein PQJ59_10145 [Spirochaetales bacterium]|nr:hypothetical protein [Spirochaetales bacterium]